jgi:class 3 adenylate cyclase
VEELPTGTVTFLFTDIEGSTRLWEQHPAAMQAALDRRKALLRKATESHGGFVFTYPCLANHLRSKRRLIEGLAVQPLQQLVRAENVWQGGVPVRQAELTCHAFETGANTEELPLESSLKRVIGGQ